MIDPIADMLTRIRNASAVKKHEVVLPMSNIKHKIAKILEAENWVQKVEVVKAGLEEGSKAADKKSKGSGFDQLRIILKYKKSGKPTISSLKRISKPGLRIYVNKEELPRVLNGLGMAVISTSQGLMTNKEAMKKGVGGEVICEIY